MDERNARLYCGEVGYGCQVLSLLHGSGSQHGEAGLAAGHHVLVVSEDGEGVGCKGAGGNVEHCRKQLTCNLVHIWNHQQETLGSGESRGEGTCLE